MTYPAGPPMPPSGWWGPPPPPKPGAIPLRPLGVNDLLGGAIEVVRRNPRAILGAGLLAALATGALSMVGSVQQFRAERADGPLPAHPTASEALRPLRRAAVGLLIQFPASLLISAALSGLVAVTTMRDVLGIRTTLGEAWGRSRRFVLPVVLAALLSGLLAGLGLLLLIVPGVFLFVRWYAAVPALVIEQLRPVAAMRRSWGLVRGATWRVLGLLLLAALILGGITGVVSAVAAVVAHLAVGGPQPFEPGASFPIAYYAIVTASVLLVSAVIAPIASVYSVLVYLDLRMRKEGLDQTLRAALERAAATGQPPL